MLERCGITDAEDAALWDNLVEQLLGPTMPSDPPERRRRHALALADAALRTAGDSATASQGD